MMWRMLSLDLSSTTVFLDFDGTVVEGDASTGKPHKHGNAGDAAGKTVNKVCPMTGDVVNAFHTREFKGQTVGFCDGDCALRWDGLSDEVREQKLSAAVAGTTEKVPHGHQEHK